MSLTGFVGVGDSTGGTSIIKEDGLGVLGSVVVGGMTIKVYYAVEA